MIRNFSISHLKIILPGLLILSSCISSKRVNYLQSAAGAPEDTVYQTDRPDYKLQTGDILYIKINSMEEQSQNLFNPFMSSSGGSSSLTNLGGFYTIGYTVDKEGNIDLPVMGKMPVRGYTIQELHDTLQNRVDQFLNESQVVVKLVNFKVTILGEVKNPGEKKIFQDQLSIMDAIGMAGDITYYGDRKNVRVVRQTNQGTFTYNVDLTDENLISSPAYYLQPSDIVYVKPVRMTFFRVTAQDYSVLITTFTSTLTAVLLLFNLLK